MVSVHMPSGLRFDETNDLRDDLGAKASTREYAVMTNAWLQMMEAHRVRKPSAQFVGRDGLAEAGDIIALAFDRHQCRSRDRRWFDRDVAMTKHPPCQGVLDEYLLHRCR